jgi:hypothetical protein
MLRPRLSHSRLSHRLRAALVAVLVFLLGGMVAPTVDTLLAPAVPRPAAPADDEEGREAKSAALPSAPRATRKSAGHAIDSTPDRIRLIRPPSTPSSFTFRRTSGGSPNGPHPRC